MDVSYAVTACVVDAMPSLPAVIWSEAWHIILTVIACAVAYLFVTLLQKRIQDRPTPLDASSVTLRPPRSQMYVGILCVAVFGLMLAVLPWQVEDVGFRILYILLFGGLTVLGGLGFFSARLSSLTILRGADRFLYRTAFGIRYTVAWRDCRDYRLLSATRDEEVYGLSLRVVATRSDGRRRNRTFHIDSASPHFEELVRALKKNRVSERSHL